MNESLIYVFDPLCGWCFAFGPTWKAVREAHGDLPVQLVYGGLVVGERVGPIAQHRDYLIAGLQRVAQVADVHAGSEFYEGLLAEGTYVSDSEPPCRAIWVMEQLAPEAAVAFAAELPDAHYGRGMPIDDPDVLGELAARHGVAAATFKEHFASDAARAGVQAAFSQARRLGALTYPTLYFRRGERAALIAQGYSSPAQTVDAIRTARNSEF